MSLMEEKLIEAGIRGLKEFGYPCVTKENILTDDIYKIFFIRMLEGTKEDAHYDNRIVGACDSLLSRISK
jgi:hypothetical protein